MNSNVTRPTIFLDTNALQYLNSYLRYAKKFGLPPHASEPQEYGDVRDTLRKHLPKDIADLVMKGCQTLAFIQQQASDEENGAALFSSRLSKAELLFGILDGQAHAHLARQGLSYRMRQRLIDLSELVSMYLHRQDYEELLQELDELFTVLERSGGIRIEFVEDRAEYFASVPTFSELLQSSVFLDVLDCWMYGCAVAVQAERIITFDRYLKGVINRIENPQGQSEWQQLQSRILEELKRLFPVETSIQLSLPVAQDLPKAVPKPWGEKNA